MKPQDKDETEACEAIDPPIVLHAKAHEVDGTIEWGLGMNPDPPAGFLVNLDFARKSGPKKVIIHLAGNTGGIKFDTEDPIWVSETRGCPPPDSSKSPQITDVQCNSNMLSFVDKNEGSECVLTYQLNFAGAGARPLDPMIRNGGDI